MKYRQLGKTGLMVSEIGLGAEWFERHTAEECQAIVDRCEELGINLLDCWMSEPNVRTNIGNAIKGRREKWYVQGHLGSTWQDGQYVRTRDPDKVKAAFQDFLERFQTDYVDLGMIHYVDDDKDWDTIVNGPFLEYVQQLKADGVIRHIGLSTHNPHIAKRAVESGIIEMLMFSINPAFDLLPDIDNVANYYLAETYADLAGIAPERTELYHLCEQHGVGITVMKPYAGGRLFDAKTSQFGVAMTPIQCIHYALTRPAVASVLAGYDCPEHVDAAVAYETATDAEKDYASVLAGAPRHAFDGQCTYCGHCKPCPVNIDIAMVNKLYDLATMQPEIPASVKAHYEALPAAAADCIACGGCETRCPFHVKVAERMEKAAELFR